MDCACGATTMWRFSGCSILDEVLEDAGIPQRHLATERAHLGLLQHRLRADALPRADGRHDAADRRTVAPPRR